GRGHRAPGSKAGVEAVPLPPPPPAPRDRTSWPDAHPTSRGPPPPTFAPPRVNFWRRPPPAWPPRTYRAARAPRCLRPRSGRSALPELRLYVPLGLDEDVDERPIIEVSLIKLGRHPTLVECAALFDFLREGIEEIVVLDTLQDLLFVV